ncbi:MAG: hypothetical protein WCI92_08020 [Bacteroidota bacterium]
MARPKHIILRLSLLALTVLMVVASATAQIIVASGETIPLSVKQVPGDTYVWELYNNVNGVNFATMPGNCPATEAFFEGSFTTGSTVNVTWLSPGVYFFKVTGSRAGCTKNLKVGKVIVLESTTTATLLQPPPICRGEITSLTITLTGTGPWSIDLSDGSTIQTYEEITTNPFILNISPLVNTVYYVTKVTDATGTNYIPSNSVMVTVNPKPSGSRIYQYNPGFKKK